MPRSRFRWSVIERSPRAKTLAGDKRARDRLLPVLVSVVEALRAQPGIGSRQIRAAVRSLRGKCSDADTDAALVMLGAGVQVSIGPRGDRHYTLELQHAPADVRAYVAAPTHHRPYLAAGISPPGA